MRDSRIISDKTPALTQLLRDVEKRQTSQRRTVRRKIDIGRPDQNYCITDHLDQSSEMRPTLRSSARAGMHDDFVG
jgi:hypothetical protein